MHLFFLPLLAALSPAAGPADAPLPPDKAAQAMRLPEGFRVSLVASEPQLVKPIAMTLEGRGRLWVVESHSYPHWIKDGKEGRDRILIFEDKQGKGSYDCTVFWDKGTNLSGIAVGFGGVNDLNVGSVVLAILGTVLVLSGYHSIAKRRQ